MKILKKVYESLIILTLTLLVMFAYLGYLAYIGKNSEKGVRQCIEMFLK